MKIQKFDGGLSTRLAPHFIGLNQSTVNVNIDNAVGILAPVKDKTAVHLAVPKYFKYFTEEDRLITSTEYKDYVEFQGFLFATDRLGRPTKLRGNDSGFLGIERPQLAPSAAKVDSVNGLQSLSLVSSTEAVQDDNIGPQPLTGNLPSTLLKYMLFVERDGKLSVGYSVEVESTENGTISNYLGNFSRGEEEFNSRFNLSSVVDTTRVVQILNVIANPGEKISLYRFYRGTWRKVDDTSIFTSFSDPATITDYIYDISGREALDFDSITTYNGTYQYVYTYYNVNDGTESAPSDASAELEIDSGHMVVSLPSTSNDPQVTNKRIYRVGGNLGVFTLVDTVAADTVSYEDILSDTEVDGRTLQSENYFEAPAGLKYLSESYAMLFGALGRTLRFTPIGKPNAWPPEYSLEFEADITGIGPVANGILVMTMSSTHLVTGTGPFALSPQQLRGDQGCIAHESIQRVAEGAVVWASLDGLCVSSGNNPKNITKYQLGDLKFNPTSSGVHNEVYYLHNNDGIIFVWDYRFEPVFKQLDLGVDYIQEYNNSMRGSAGNTIYSLFTSQEDLSLQYSSPKFIEGSMTELKNYSKIFCYTEGQIELSVYIDDNLVITKSFTTKGLKEFKVPQECQRGYFISFSISGTGTVSELEYEVGRRKNG